MALLNSLEICGIRNFSPDNAQSIFFNTPMVLFQGPNGSGKTTILEAIRYCLTGEIPGGASNGQGFINEPKISNRSLTKGSIKVKFCDAEGNIITVIRVLQVQYTPKGLLQFKKLNQTIRKRDKDGHVADISGRCLDIDNFCCTSLNVSKSIFNNVLFCHQENSLWPLDEPLKLKKKFDEIFDAVKYNNCIESTRKYIKQKQAHLRVLQERVENRKIIKQMVDKQRAKLDERKEKLAEINEGIEQKKNELKSLENRMKEIIELEETLFSLKNKLTAKEEEKRGLCNQQLTIRKDILNVFNGTDEELENEIKSFKEQQSAEESSICKLEQAIQDASEQLESVNRKIQDKQVFIGQLKEEKNQHNKNIEESNELVDKLRIELDVKEFDDNEILLGELANALKAEQEQFNVLQNEKETEENKLQSQIDNLRENTAKIEQTITSKSMSVKEFQNKLEEIRVKLEELDTSDSQLKNVTDNIERLQSNLTKLKNSFNENEKLKEIDKLKDSIKNKEQYLENLDKDNRILQRNYATEQNIESEENVIVEKQVQINRIKTKHSQNLKTLFDTELPENNLRKSVVEIQNKQETEFKTILKNVNTLERDLATSETMLNHLKNSLKTSQQDLSTNKRKVSLVCKGRDFKSVLEESILRKEKLHKNKGHFTSAKIMYEAFIANFEQKNCCPVCQTNFTENRSAIPEIIKELKRKIEKVPSDLIKVESDLKKEEFAHNELQQLKAVNDVIETLMDTKIPELEREISIISKKVEDSGTNLATEKIKLETPQKLIEVCKNILTDATLFDQYHMDIAKAKDRIENLKCNIEKVPSNRSREETEVEIDAVKGDLSNKRHSYETNKNMLEFHRDKCQELNKKIQTEVQKQINIQKFVQEKPLLEIQNAEFNDKLFLLVTDIEESKLELIAQKNKLKEAVEKKSKVTKVNTQLKDEARNKLVTHQNALTNIHSLQKKKQEYERKKNNEKLEIAVEQLAKLQVIVQNIEKNKNEASDSITRKKEAIAKNETEFRALKDNINLRKIQKQEAIVIGDIDKIKEKIGDFNYQKVYEEKKKKTEHISTKLREINRLKGQLVEVQTQVDDVEDELRQPDYKNAYKNFNKISYELILNNLATEDLIKYVTVLERSVLKFHEEKMVMINTTIKSLWRTIYRGNDIDFIQIKTDETTGGTEKRRKYDYRVVQVKNNVEIDMRGRCSAGQKVLACLVIRMALAETFSTNCGILALDEPTTNLDKANISSLSDALSELINSRQNQSNFQLLIITHDEEFLRSITQAQSIDSYWQVKRNCSGNSVVERQLL